MTAKKTAKPRRRTASTTRPTPAPLAAWRTQLDAINGGLVALLDLRTRVVAVVARWKAQQGAAIVDRARERAMLAAVVRGARGRSAAARAVGLTDGELHRIFSAVFAASRRVARSAARGAATRGSSTRGTRPSGRQTGSGS